MANYFKQQLKRLLVSSSTMAIKITDSSGAKTNYLTLNDKKSITILIKFLEERKEVSK